MTKSVDIYKEELVIRELFDHAENPAKHFANSDRKQKNLIIEQLAITHLLTPREIANLCGISDSAVSQRLKKSQISPKTLRLQSAKLQSATRQYIDLMEQRVATQSENSDEFQSKIRPPDTDDPLRLIKHFEQCDRISHLIPASPSQPRIAPNDTPYYGLTMLYRLGGTDISTENLRQFLKDKYECNIKAKDLETFFRVARKVLKSEFPS